MAECYTDRFLRLSDEDLEIQGLHVKLPFLDRFIPVGKVDEVPEEPDMLKIVLCSGRFPPMPEEPCEQNYFVHKSQVIFRTCCRFKESL
nr:hypothetical protein [uncultured Dethiosulfovibrio sp.]